MSAQSDIEATYLISRGRGAEGLPGSSRSLGITDGRQRGCTDELARLEAGGV